MLAKYMIYFTFMGFIGYIYECIAMTLWLGRWDNRGSLYGPFIPIYGLGALEGSLFLIHCLPEHTPLVVFLTGLIGSALLEYPIHYLIDKYLHQTYWDYSRSPLNLHGRICLPAAIGFGIGALVIICGINPMLIPWIENLPVTAVNFFAGLAAMILILDIFFSAKGLKSSNPRLDEAENRINQTMDRFFRRFLTEGKGIDRLFFGAVERISRFSPKSESKTEQKTE